MSRLVIFYFVGGLDGLRGLGISFLYVCVCGGGTYSFKRAGGGVTVLFSRNLILLPKKIFSNLHFDILVMHVKKGLRYSIQNIYIWDAGVG